MRDQKRGWISTLQLSSVLRTPRSLSIDCPSPYRYFFHLWEPLSSFKALLTDRLGEAPVLTPSLFLTHCLELGCVIRSPATIL